MPLSADAAETIAIKALGWLLSEPETLGVFMGSTGVSAEDFRANAGDSQFLGSVLDFVLMDDAWVISFCESCGIPYEHVMHARAALPGGEQVHWT
ncbi:MAG: DUF3572 domain-containing protein [Arenibacterium sp.]